MERLIVLDTETTGLDPLKGDRVIEIGCVEIINRNINPDNEYHQYIQPDCNVGESVRIHGITDNFLVGKPKFEEIAEEFLEYIDSSTLVIHNAQFDIGFLNNELDLISHDKRIEDYCDVIDSLQLSKQQNPGMMHSLDALSRRFSIDSSNRSFHGALLDAQILSQVYLAMTGGQSNLFKSQTFDNEEKDNKDLINKISKNRKKIKIIKANKKELAAHKNYFK
jgi:DNA polymerase-3 subunit epsilon